MHYTQAYPRPRRGRPKPGVRAITCLIGTLLSACGSQSPPRGSDQPEPFAETPASASQDPARPTEAQAKEFLRSGSNHYARALRRGMSSLDTVTGAKERFQGRSNAEALAMGAEIGLAGIRRLSAADHIERARLTRQMLENTDEATCAALVHQGTPAQYMAATATLDSVSAERMVALRMKAMAAELRGSPPARPLPSEREVEEAFAALFRVMERGDEGDSFERMAAALDDPDAASARDLCQAGRTLARWIESLPQRPKEVLSRAIAR